MSQVVAEPPVAAPAPRGSACQGRARAIRGPVLHRDRRRADRGDAVQHAGRRVGAGYAAPAAFIVATVVLTIFSVGYIEMARRVSAAGGFYSFVIARVRPGRGPRHGRAIALCYVIFTGAVLRRHELLREHHDRRLDRRRHPGLGLSRRSASR